MKLLGKFRSAFFEEPSKSDSKKKERIFLDYASGTPMCLQVRKELEGLLKKQSEGEFLNPSSIHAEGRRARELLEASRSQVARFFSVHADEIVFTSGATEGDNIALFGVFEKALEGGIRHPHIITSVLEHPSLLEPLRALEKKGALVTFLSPDEGGNIPLSHIEEVITEETVLLCFSLVNSELGSILPFRQMKEILLRTKKKFSRYGTNEYPYLHIDATQAADLLPIYPHDIGADLLSIDGGKVYGPHASGALFVKEGTNVSALFHGGGQERGRRSGMQNIFASVGLAKALQISQFLREKEYKRQGNLREQFLSLLKKEIPEAKLNTKAKHFLPSIVSICFPEISAEYLSLLLDEEGVAVGVASACRRLKDGSSSAVSKIPGKEECEGSTLRFSFGRKTKYSHLRRVIFLLKRYLSLAQKGRAKKSTPRSSL
ncbi:MAG: cysteine desulfurase family protein [Patescibacteria group bacterium]